MSPAHREVTAPSWLSTAITGGWVALLVLLAVLAVLNTVWGSWLGASIAFVMIVTMVVDEVRRRVG